MNTHRRSSKASLVREPVQVYLDGPDKERLERLTSRLDSTKSDVLRRGLQALEQQLSDPRRHPALRIAGIVDVLHADTADAAREHDRLIAEAEEEAWSGNEVG